jgi:predicted ATP-dependent endonuclease of OLD family
MKLISEIQIKGFRSIRDSRLSDLGDFTSFAGLNNSGKSNVLRALNAFFNGETDPGHPLNLDLDYYRPDLRKKKAKRISIGVKFSLPGQFKFRKGLQGVEKFLGNKSFWITKEWTRSELLPAYHLNDSDKLNLEDRQKIDQFLQLINFRYIPNRVLPIDVIRSEHQALRDVLVRRLGTRGKGQEEAFEAIKDTSKKMVQALIERFQQACPYEGEVRLATPTSWNEMVFAFGYRLSRDGIEVEDAAQGSGIQSLLMLETLFLIDRDYFQKFGWRQAAIWAVEEPESSLHTTLEAQIAAYLAGISLESASRLQVLCTTHSDLMLQYSDSAILVERKDVETKFTPMRDVRRMLETLSRAGVSRWVHPILHSPLDPLILVEGKYDEAFFQEAFRYVRPKKRIRVQYLEEISDGGATGGVDDLHRYVKANMQPIKARRKDAPVVVVLDWDSAAKKDAFAKLFGANDSFTVLVWPESCFNPKLSKSFRGIERHFSDRMIRQARKKASDLFFRSAKGVWSVQSSDFGKVKGILFEIVKEGLEEEDFIHARSFIEETLAAAGASQ